MSWDHVVSGMAGTNPQMYAAVKGGIASFSRGLARSVAPRVRVNVLAPGWIETAFGDGLDSETYRSVADSTPLRPLGHAGRRGRRGRVPGVARGRVHHRADDHGRRRRRDVA